MSRGIEELWVWLNDNVYEVATYTTPEGYGYVVVEAGHDGCYMGRGRTLEEAVNACIDASEATP